MMITCMYTQKASTQNQKAVTETESKQVAIDSQVLSDLIGL